MASVERRSWWWTWLQVPGVGIGRLKQLEQAFGSLQAAWWAPAEQLLATPGVGPSLLAGRNQLQRNGSALPLPVPAKVLLPADAAMPAALKALPQPPASLFWRGRGALWPLLRRQQAIAVIGSRRASPYGCSWAQRPEPPASRDQWAAADAQAHQGSGASFEALQLRITSSPSSGALLIAATAASWCWWSSNRLG